MPARSLHGGSATECAGLPGASLGYLCVAGCVGRLALGGCLIVELHIIYVVLYAAAAILASVVVLVAWTHRAARGATSLAMLMLGVAAWSGGYAVMWYVPTFEQQVFWEKSVGLGNWLVPVGFLALAFDIAGMERWRSPGRIALISIAAFSLDNLEWWNPGRLYDKAFVASTIGSYTHFEPVPGPLYWVFVAFAYTLIVIAFVIIFRVCLRSAGAERMQAAILLLGAGVPFIASTPTGLKVVPLDIDLAPLAFLATGALWLAAILRGTLLDVLPLARDVLVEQMVDGVVVVDEADRVVDANPAALAMLNSVSSEVLGKTAEAVLTSVNGATDVLRGDGPRHAVLPIGADDDPRYVELAVTRLVVSSGGPSAQLVTLHDVTEERRASQRLADAQEELKHNATHDALTGLPNRFLLDDRLEHAIAHARREDCGLAVLFVDLDDFKAINDTLGHAQGDALLVQVAERIVPALRDSDTVGRFGGDEFTVIITDLKDASQVGLTARRLLEAIASPYRLGDEDLRITASVGVALFPTDGDDATSLIQHADLAMYGAKGLGRNRVQFFSKEFQDGLNRRMVVEKELWGADEEERYFLLYQPQVDLSTGQITGVEALVRLRARDGTVLSPAEFIPVAEDSDLIFRLGDWVLRRACAELAILHEAAPDLIMSVNLSARQFKRIDVTSMQKALQESGVEARSLALEITETALLADPEETAARLEDLRSVAGLRLSLDDFGTGYSSLTYVRVFRADTIKIDRSLIGLLPDDHDAQAIVLSTIALAKSLHATVIAEGPETEEQVRFLRANGCDCAQGFYFSRPAPADELALLLRKGPFPLPEV